MKNIRRYLAFMIALIIILSNITSLAEVLKEEDVIEGIEESNEIINSDENNSENPIDAYKEGDDIDISDINRGNNEEKNNDSDSKLDYNDNLRENEIDIENLKEEIITVDDTGNDESRDLKEVKEFDYEVNLYLDGKKIDNELTLDKENHILQYGVNFTIKDNFMLNNEDYINLDISGLSKIDGFKFTDLKEDNKLNFQIKDSEGHETELEVGEYFIDDNLLKIIFNKNIEKLNTLKERKGFAELSLDISSTNTDQPLVEVVEIDGFVNKTLTIIRENEKTSDISKVGNYDKNLDKIIWTIDVNTKLENLENVSLEDSLHQDLKLEKVEIIDLKVTTSSIVEDGEYKDISEDKYTINNNLLDIKLGNLNRESKRIKLTTSFKDSFSSDSKNNISNTVKLKTKGEEKASSTADVSFTRTKSLTKEGEIIPNSNSIKWTISFMGNNNNEQLEFTDTLDFEDNLQLKIRDVKVDNKKLELLDNKSLSADKEDNKEGYFIDKSDDKSDKEIKFLINDNKEGLRSITYYTDLIYLDGFEVDKKYKIENTVKLEDLEAKADVDIKREELLEKAGGKPYGEDGETYLDWEIIINKGKEKLSDVSITDYIPEGFKLVSYKLEELEGKEVIKETEVEEEGEKTFKLGNIDKSYKLTIRTKLVDESIFLNVEEDSKIINKAKIMFKKSKEDGEGGEGIIGDGASGEEDNSYEYEVSADISKDSFKSTASKSNKGINYNTGKASWSSEYTTYKEGIKDLTITDKLNNHHKYDKNSFKITINNATYKLVESTLESTEEDSNKENQTKNEENQILKYSLKFSEKDGVESFYLVLNSGANFRDQYNKIKLEYETNFDLSSLDDTDKLELSNKIKYGDIEASSNVNIKGEVALNGNKQGKLSNRKDRIFTWTAYLNYKSKDIKDSKITDELSDGHYYIENSIKIYKAEINENGGLEKSEEEPIGESSYTVIFTTKDKKDLEDSEEVVSKDFLNKGGKNNKLEITFNSTINHPLIIEYETQADNISKSEYSNEIKFNEKTYKATTSFDKWNDFIDKTLINSRGDKVINGDILEWNLTINESISTIKNLEITDIMDKGLRFIPSTLKVDGEDNLGPFTLEESSESGFKLTANEITKPYKITYKTLVDADKLDKISNQARISGEGILEEKESSKTYNVISRLEAGGSGLISEDTFDLKLVKVDANKEEIKKDFKIKLIIKTKIGDDILTSEEECEVKDGVLTLNLIKNENQSYYVKEVEAPEGYFLLDDEIEVKAEDINDKNELEIRIVNVGAIDFPVKKIWEGGSNNRPTIELQLYRDDKKYRDPVELKSGVTEYTFKNLPESDKEGKNYKYHVDEVKVPYNYKKEIVDKQTIKNIYNPRPSIEKIDIPVEKIWKDLSKEDLPEEIEVKLYKRKDGNREEIKGKSILLDSSNNWKSEFKDLPKYYESTREEIIYEVEELVPEGFEVTVEGDYKTGFKIINKKIEKDPESPNKPEEPKDPEDPNKPEEPKDPESPNKPEEPKDPDRPTRPDKPGKSPKDEYIDLYVKKFWDGPKLSSITVKLLADGEEVKTVKLSEENDWFYKFKDLDILNKSGEKIIYTIEEESLADYSLKLSIDKDKGFILYNTYKVKEDPKEEEGHKVTEEEKIEEKQENIESEKVKEENKDIFVDLNEKMPEGGLEIKENLKNLESDLKGYISDKLPKTGENFRIVYYLIGLTLIILGFKSYKD